MSIKSFIILIVSIALAAAGLLMREPSHSPWFLLLAWWAGVCAIDVWRARRSVARSAVVLTVLCAAAYGSVWTVGIQQAATQGAMLVYAGLTGAVSTPLFTPMKTPRVRKSAPDQPTV